MLSDIQTSGNKTCETIASGWLIYLNFMLMHGLENVTFLPYVFHFTKYTHNLNYLIYRFIRNNQIFKTSQ